MVTFVPCNVNYFDKLYAIFCSEPLLTKSLLNIFFFHHFGLLLLPQDSEFPIHYPASSTGASSSQ